MSAPRAALAAIMAACVLPCCWAIGVASPGASVASHHLGFFEQQACASSMSAIPEAWLPRARARASARAGCCRAHTRSHCAV
jgi:hypothetical protein